MKTRILTLLLCAGSLATLWSQEDTIPDMVTDRPDATESPNIVVPGWLQIETGGAYESFKANNTKTEAYTFNTTLLRFGVLENVELRLGWNLVEVQTTVNGTKLEEVANGLSPLLAGAKIKISEEKGWLPEMALLGHLYLPFTAGADFKPETTGADFRFSMAHTLNERSSLSYNIGAQWGDDSPEVAYIYTLSYGLSLSDCIGFYAELYGDFPENSAANHFWDAGFTYLVCRNLQFDATVGSSITDGQDILLSAGVSYRIPK